MRVYDYQLSHNDPGQSHCATTPASGTLRSHTMTTSMACWKPASIAPADDMIRQSRRTWGRSAMSRASQLPLKHGPCPTAADRAHGRMTVVATTRRAERPEPDRLSSRRAERPAFGRWATGGGRVRKVRPPPPLPTLQLERWRFAVYRRPADVDIGGGAAGHVDDHALGTVQM